jgi:hypothetical protein
MTEPESFAFLTRMLQRVFERPDLAATPELTAKEEMDDIENLGALARIVRAHAAARS